MKDRDWAQYYNVRNYVVGWNGRIHATWDGFRGTTGYSLYDLKKGRYSLMYNGGAIINPIP